MVFIIDWKMRVVRFISIGIFIVVVMGVSNIVENICECREVEIGKFRGILGRVV